MPRPRACILAVGTEVTSGQIVNGNAAWLSGKLTELGLEISLHEAVPDDRPLIHRALERCASEGGFLFVTGGLGPTTDDFTREVVAEWLGKPLEFHEPSWTQLQARLERFGVKAVASQRQQCFFPQGAEVFENPAGTANAFGCVHGDKRVFVLPGPPKEIHAVWDGSVEKRLRGVLPVSEPLRLLCWQTIGRPEAEVGEAVENALRGNGFLTTGYRLHRPYIEVKVWCPESRIPDAQPWIEKLEQALGPSLIARGNHDIGADLLEQLRFASDVEIFDRASAGLLAERLGKLIRTAGPDAQPHKPSSTEAIALNTEWAPADAPLEWVQGLLAEATPETLTLAIAGFSPAGDWAIGLRLGGSTRTELLKSPYKDVQAPEILERVRRYAVEIALQRWTGWLRGLFH